MAGPIQVFDVTYTAGEDLTSSQYRAVVAGSTADHCNLPSAAKVGKVLGVLQNAPASGSAARVRKLGISKGKAAGTIAFGEHLEIAAATGTLQTYTNGESNGSVGIAEEAAVADDVFELFVLPIDFNDILS